MTVKKGLKPSMITFTSVLQVLIKSKRIQQAIDIFNHVLEIGMRPDQVLFNVIINGCVYNGRLREACGFLKESFKGNIKLCGDVYKNILNNLCTNKVMKAEEKNELCVYILGTLKDKGYHLDEEIYNKVLRMVYRNSKSDEKDMKYKDDYDEYEEGQVDDDYYFRKANGEDVDIKKFTNKKRRSNQQYNKYRKQYYNNKKRYNNKRYHSD